MNRLMAVLLGLLCLGAPATAAPQLKTIDPASVGYTLSTLAADAPRMDPLKSVPTSSLAFHEDEWRQIEFYPRDRVAEIQRTLISLKAFADEHRKGQGWSDVYLRKLPPRALIVGPKGLASLEAALGLQAESAPALFYGDDVVVGRVSDGFSMRVARGVWLYGESDDAGVTVLGALVEEGGEDIALVNAFVALNKAYDLVLVDWRSQQLYLSVMSDGRIETWAP